VKIDFVNTLHLQMKVYNKTSSNYLEMENMVTYLHRCLHPRLAGDFIPLTPTKYQGLSPRPNWGLALDPMHSEIKTKVGTYDLCSGCTHRS